MSGGSGRKRGGYREGRVTRITVSGDDAQRASIIMSRGIRRGGNVVCAGKRQKGEGREGEREEGKHRQCPRVNDHPVDDRTTLCQSVDRGCRLTDDAYLFDRQF
ncbi:hypothetical protein P5V15_004763 [Pogonomyrmex californicus]